MSKGTAICVDGGQVYAAGFVGTGGNSRGTVWRGGGTVLRDLGPRATVYAMAVSDGHVYAAGVEGYNARVWRDGEVMFGIDEPIAKRQFCNSNGVGRLRPERSRPRLWSIMYAKM